MAVLPQAFGKAVVMQATLIFFIRQQVQYWENLMDRVFNYDVDGWKVDESDYNIRQLGTLETSVGQKTFGEYSGAYYI